MSLQMSAVGLSDVGRKREKNEDSFMVDEKLGFAMVADGMGGHSGGEFASKIAVETISEVLKKLASDPEMTLHGKTTIRPHDHGGKLNYAIQEAGRRIYDHACSEPELKGMGTTAVALLTAEGRVYLGNVGDSRGYLLRGGVFRQLTQDHSFVGEQVRAGVITPEIAKTHRMRNVITRSVGFQSEVDSDILQKTAKNGDIFLLCSDGLSNMVDDAEMKAILETNPPKDACRKLVDIANAHGGEDNITVVIVCFNETNGAKSRQDTDAMEETTIEL